MGDDRRSTTRPRQALFEQILGESLFFEWLTIPKDENRDLACGILSDKLQKAKAKLADLHLRTSFDTGWKILQDERVQKVFYRTEVSRTRFDTALHEADPNEFFRDYRAPVEELFREDRQGAKSINKALSRLLGLVNEDGSPGANRPIPVIDLSKAQARGLFWNDKIQSLVIKRLLDGLSQTAEYFYKEGQSLNALVVIDEAHRLAPRELPREDDAAHGVRAVLVDAAHTTREYGLGWLFISQTPWSLKLVGSSGSGQNTALDLYKLFRAPHSAFDPASRQYSFMTIGPVSPLFFSGSPLFLNAFITVEAFLGANGLRSA